MTVPPIPTLYSVHMDLAVGPRARSPGADLLPMTLSEKGAEACGRVSGSADYGDVLHPPPLKTKTISTFPFTNGADRHLPYRVISTFMTERN
jgi:hypothetical protein